MITHDPAAYKLLHEGVQALSQVEASGIRVDTGYLEKAITGCERDMERIIAKLESHSIWKKWEKKYRYKSTLNSAEQLGWMLYEKLGFPVTAHTKTGTPSTDEPALMAIDHPWVRLYLKLKKIQKMHKTYLSGIQREVSEDGFLRPSFNLHLVQTFRSSCDSPNLQNMPIRLPEMGAMIRQCFIPRKGNLLGEIDYSGIEVRVAACYHKDPVMVRYINDTTKDMHRDMGAQIFCMGPGDVSKPVRHCGKNMFVFPQFYGDFYISNARQLWDAITTMELTGPGGIPMREHLAENGITSLGTCDPKQKPKKGTFEEHMKEVEDDFWNRRFKVYGKWKKNWYNSYLDKGHFKTLTGFVIGGHMNRKQVINYPVQGSAFHCLLWSLIRLVTWLGKNKMRTKIVGQVHDSIIADIDPHELPEFMAKAKEVMTQDITRWATWLNVPLEVEAELSPPGLSWHSKKEVGYEDGKFLFAGDSYGSPHKLFTAMQSQ